MEDLFAVNQEGVINVIGTTYPCAENSFLPRCDTVSGLIVPDISKDHCALHSLEMSGTFNPKAQRDILEDLNY